MRVCSQHHHGKTLSTHQWIQHTAQCVVKGGAGINKCPTAAPHLSLAACSPVALPAPAVEHRQFVSRPQPALAAYSPQRISPGLAFAAPEQQPQQQQRQLPRSVSSSDAATTMTPPMAKQRSFLDIQADVALPAIGGHRGMGANVIRGGALAPAWRENTLRSFQAAAASGATFVEFDVQVTSDGVPVIWHDDTVEYGDPSDPNQCAVSELTSAEFQALGTLSASGKCQQLSVVRRFKHAAAAKAALAPAEAAELLSGSVAGEPALTPLRQRWCCEVDDAFPTLEQLFQALPEHLAFNIEVKMATPSDLAVTPAAEIQRMVGPILDVVNRCTLGSPDPAAQQRQVVFSSFDPDVCRALREAQQQHQVMFLTTGGRDWHADPRRMSLAAAVDEAASAQLSGVVMDSGALHAYPEVVAQARGAGLQLLTYGLENDSVSWVLQQQQLGVTGVIVDDLEGLMTALRSGSASPPPPAILAAGAAASSEAAAAAAAASVAEDLVVGQVAVQATAAVQASASAAAANVALMSVPSAQQPLRPAVMAT